MASTELAAEGEGANAGVLDMQKGLAWTRQHISAFGGDPDSITIDGQSAGGQSVITLLTLYNGTNPLFHKAIARSAARGFTLNVAESDVRTDLFAGLTRRSRAIASMPSYSTARILAAR